MASKGHSDVIESGAEGRSQALPTVGVRRRRFPLARPGPSAFSACLRWLRGKPLLIATFIFLLATISAAEQLSIAAAADLNFALQDIAAAYQHDTGNTVKIAYGSSGNFFTQIQNGAPFDVFFSADVNFPRQLESASLAEPGTLYQYATGKIVLWVPKGSTLDLARGLDLLLDPAIRRIAMANPKHAPYGRAAEAALRKAGIHSRVEPKLVLGENISQTAQFVETGNADIGILALSLVTSPTMQSRGRWVEIPAALYPPISQAAVVLKSSRKKSVAKSFLEYLQRPEAKSILRKYGFQ
jgi:molybdate transport system substrate-binding protein